VSEHVSEPGWLLCKDWQGGHNHWWMEDEHRTSKFSSPGRPTPHKLFVYSPHHPPPPTTTTTTELQMCLMWLSPCQSNACLLAAGLGWQPYQYIVEGSHNQQLREAG
jgi:hypothetical protein